MLNKRYKYIMAAAFFILPLMHVSAQQAAHPTYIAWPAVDGASGYIIEIKDSQGRRIYRQQASANNIRPSLPYGEYQMKITVLNLFGREASSTEWVTLSIIKSEIPVYTSIKPAELKPGSKTGTVEIFGDNFLEGCTVRLMIGSSVYPAEKVSVKSESKIECRFDLTKAVEGTYSLIIENPAGKISVSENNVKVLQERNDQLFINGNGIPKIRKIYPASLFTGKEQIEIELFGNNLNENCTVFFSSGSLKFKGTIKKFDGMYLIADFPADTAAPGKYDVSVVKESKTDTLKSALNVKDPVNGYLGFNGLYFGAGYDAMLLFPAWNSILNNGFTGSSLYAGRNLDALGQMHWLTYFGIEASAGFSYFTTKSIENKRNGYLAFAPFTAGIYGHIAPLIPQLDVILRIDGGFAGSYLSLSGGSSSGKVYSTDALYSAGGSLRYTMEYLYFAEIGGDYMTCLYKKEALTGVHIFMRAGFRL